MRISRARIPFVIGGWGTRGKSGTERKKAALFQALGFNIICKTTGCETTIIHAKPGLDAVEIPIYRPGNKPTIWEQEKVIRWTDKMNAQVFLWECMALSSDYAQIMQHSWMKDDLATISNTFVDHENIQGPAGVDIPRSMTSFIPPKSTLFTAEENMLPILKDYAAKIGTKVVPLSRNEAELIGRDALSMFPYKVHPRNLGMVLKLAEHIGVDSNFALREIARNIVPDLGSFKSVQTEFRNRILEFWSGMSANDRTSCLNNWEQGGFNSVSSIENTWIVSVVNNRDDRILRSREFAETIINYTPAHLHILIGTNLNGFTGYIQDALSRFIERNCINPERIKSIGASKSMHLFRQHVNNILKWLRIDGLSLDHIQKKLLYMQGSTHDDIPLQTLKKKMDTKQITRIQQVEEFLQKQSAGSETSCSEIAWHLFRDLTDYNKIQQFNHKLDAILEKESPKNDDIERINKAFRSLMRNIVMDRFYVIRDPAVPGDDIIRVIINKTPPNYKIKIMGMQNIKGTGMDFAYRWESLDKVKKAINDLSSKKYDVRMKAANFLAAYDNYGMLDAPLAMSALKDAGTNPDNSTPEIKTVIEEALEQVKRISSHESMNGLYGRHSFKRKLLYLCEQLFELGDSKRRRRKVERVMKDLSNERISSARASQIIHEMVKRQDGGWLYRSLLSK